MWHFNSDLAMHFFWIGPRGLLFQHLFRTVLCTTIGRSRPRNERADKINLPSAISALKPPRHGESFEANSALSRVCPWNAQTTAPCSPTPKWLKEASGADVEVNRFAFDMRHCKGKPEAESRLSPFVAAILGFALRARLRQRLASEAKRLTFLSAPKAAFSRFGVGRP